MAAMSNSTNNAAARIAERVRIETLGRNHPLFLHTSDTPGVVLTSVQLIGMENYSMWSRSALINLRAKGKLGFVLGTCRKGDYRGEMQEEWEKCNALVLAWIMNSVSKELLSSIVYAIDTSMVWADLKERFDKVDGSRCYQLHRDICTLSQGTMSVSAYFSKLRLLWDEFDAVVPPPSCVCDKSRSYIDHIACLRLFTFLMGLNEVYTHARSQILMMNPLPTVGKAYAMIMADESQRVTASSQRGHNMPDMALYVGKGSVPNIASSQGGPDIALYVGKGNVPRRFGTKKFCDHCKIPGHVKEECYKLTGYPLDWKFKKKPGVMQNSRHHEAAHHVTVAKSGMEFVDQCAAPMMKGKATDAGPGIAQPAFTPDQYSRILHMLERDEANARSGSPLDNLGNMAGPLKWKGEGDW